MSDVAYLGGLGRSGTTLIERILGQLPGVATLGEVVHLWKRGIGADEQCGCGEPFSRCPFWTAVGERAFGGWGQVDLDDVDRLTSAVDRTRFMPHVALARAGSGTAEKARALAGYYARIYDAAGEVSGAQVLVDSSKHPSTAVILATHSQVPLKIAHVVRDSRGVAYSWTKKVERPEAVEGSSNAYMTRYTPSRAALLWDAHNATFSLLAKRGAPTLLTRYEDLMAHPAETITALCDFLGLPSDSVAAVLNGDSAQLQTSHTVSGNPMRFQTGKIVLRQDTAWRQKLPMRSRLAVAALTAPLMVGYRYLGPRKDTA